MVVGRSSNGERLMARGLHMEYKDPVHQALYEIVKQLLEGMEVKAKTPSSVSDDRLGESDFV